MVVIILVGWHWIIDGWYWEEEYVEHIQKSLAKETEATDESAPVYDEAVNQQKNDMSVFSWN